MATFTLLLALQTQSFVYASVVVSIQSSIRENTIIDPREIAGIVACISYFHEVVTTMKMSTRAKILLCYFLITLTSGGECK